MTLMAAGAKQWLLCNYIRFVWIYKTIHWRKVYIFRPCFFILIFFNSDNNVNEYLIFEDIASQSEIDEGIETLTKFLIADVDKFFFFYTFCIFIWRRQTLV